MNKWIKWSQSNEYDTQHGEMPIENIKECLQDFRKAGIEYINKTICDHVIYAAKEYDEDGNVKEIHFYQNLGMDDKTFNERTRAYNGQIYAIHKR